MRSTVKNGRRDWVWFGLALAVPAIAYAWTLYPGLGGRLNPGDSAKFQYIGTILGVPHQPGYPQYVVLTWVWAGISGLFASAESLASRINAFSAVTGLAAGAFLWHGVRRLATGAPIATLVTVTVSLTTAVWTFSTEAEVYSLHLAWVAATFWAAARWAEKREDGSLVVLLGIGAFAFGNHPASVALIPALAAALWTGRAREIFSLRVFAPAAGLTLLGASQYLFVLWRAHSDAPFIEGIRPGGNLVDLFRSMSGRRFSSQHVLGRGLGGGVERLGEIGLEAFVQLGPVVLLLAVLGAAAGWRRRRPATAFLATLALASVVFILVYQIGDWGAYVAPAWLALAVLAGVGLEGLPPRVRTGATAAWCLLLVAFLVRDARALHVPESPYARDALIAAAPDGAIVLPYAQMGYPARQFMNYYRFGLGFEADRGLHLESAERAFLFDWSFLGDRPIFFERSGVREWAHAYGIEHVAQQAPSGQLVYRTGTEWPTESVRLVPVGDGIEVRTFDGALLAPVGPAVSAVVVGARDGRVKGVMPFDGNGAVIRRISDEAPLMEARREEGDPELVRFLQAIRSEDRVVLVLTKTFFENSPGMAARVARAFRSQEARGRGAGRRAREARARAESIESGAFERAVVFHGPRRHGTVVAITDPAGAMMLRWKQGNS